jgi:hypothetical protein
VNPWEVIGPKEDMSFWVAAEKQRRMNEARQGVIDAAHALMDKIEMEPDVPADNEFDELGNRLKDLRELEEKE